MNQRPALFLTLLLACAAVAGCGGSARSMAVPGTAPSISLISPTTITAGSGQFNLVLNGQGLFLVSTVHFGAPVLTPSSAQGCASSSHCGWRPFASGGQFENVKSEDLKLRCDGDISMFKRAVDKKTTTPQTG